MMLLFYLVSISIYYYQQTVNFFFLYNFGFQKIKLNQIKLKQIKFSFNCRNEMITENKILCLKKVCEKQKQILSQMKVSYQVKFNQKTNRKLNLFFNKKYFCLLHITYYITSTNNLIQYKCQVMSFFFFSLSLLLI